MRKLTKEQRTMILKVLIEGTGVNSTARICGVSKLTVLRLLADAGSLCRDYHDLVVRNLRCKHVQLDEIWSFVGCKQRSKERGKQGDGDCWTWIGLDADSKLVVSYMAGLRTADCAHVFVKDVADRIEGRVQLTTDGLGMYVEAVDAAFHGFCDYAMLVKVYGHAQQQDGHYSPPECLGCRRHRVSGNPDPKQISTSFVERQNLRLRMENRRHTRLTLGYSKKWV